MKENKDTLLQHKAYRQKNESTSPVVSYATNSQKTSSTSLSTARVMAILVRGALLAKRYLPATSMRSQVRRLVGHGSVTNNQMDEQGPGMDDTAHLTSWLPWK
jgi:hypothetical protein